MTYQQLLTVRSGDRRLVFQAKLLSFMSDVAESRQAPIRLPIRGRRVLKDTPIRGQAASHKASALAQALKGDNKGKRDRDNL